MANKMLSNSGIINLSRRDYMDAVEKLAEKYNGSSSFVNIEFDWRIEANNRLCENKYRLLKYSDGELKQISIVKLESVYEYVVLHNENDDETFVGYICTSSSRRNVISLDIMLKVKNLAEAIRVIKLDLIGNDINHTLDGIFRDLQDNNDVTISDSGDAFDTCNELLGC